MMRGALAIAAMFLLHGESVAQPAPDRCGILHVQENWYASKPLLVCARRGDAEAQAWLGMLYWSASQAEFGGSGGWGIPERLTKQDMQREGLRLITLASESGVAVAQTELGRARLLGDFGVSGEPLQIVRVPIWARKHDLGSGGSAEWFLNRKVAAARRRRPRQKRSRLRAASRYCARPPIARPRLSG